MKGMGGGDAVVFERIARRRIVPVVVLEREEHAEPVAEALLKAGLDIMEVPFRTAAAQSAIRRVAKRFPQMLLGAGTVLTPEQAGRAAEAGVRFALAPGLNEDVVRAASSAGILMVPGVMTPSEVDRALGLGCRILKFFPADVAGGVSMLKALEGPYAHTGVKFIPTGGIGPANMRQYLERPSVAAVGGSWITDRKLNAGDWAAVERLAREALDIAAAVKSG